MLMTLEELRKQFPELNETVYGNKPLVYLDNAATSQRPVSVIEKWNEMSLKLNSNLHRAVHHIADLATEEYESTRQYVADYLGAESSDEIIFTSGTTQSINLLAFSFGERFVKAGDEIVVSEAEHHSNIVPWQMMCQRKGAFLKVIPVDENGFLKLDQLDELLNPRTKLVSVTHISNVLGIENPISKITSLCHSKGVPVMVDGAQGIVHKRVNLKELDCDFYAFSGHKIYAAPGTGVLYGKLELLNELPPYMGGGEMISTVKWAGTEYARVPHRFEAGTQNIAGTPTLKPALELAGLIEDSPEIQEEQRKIKEYLHNEVFINPDYRLYGNCNDLNIKAPLFSFSVDGVHHEDLALIMDKMGVALRSGQMCAEPLMDRYGKTGMLRASFASYNTLKEAEYFVESLNRAISMLR